MTLTDAKICMDTPDPNHMDITIDWDKSAPLPIYWQTPLLSSIIGHHSLSASDDLQNALSSPLQAKSMCRRQVLGYTDNEQDLPQVVNLSANLLLNNVDATIVFLMMMRTLLPLLAEK